MRFLLASLAGAAALAIAAPADAAWHRFETQHFIIYSQSPDKKVDELARGLEGIDGLMRMATGLSGDRPPVKVRIYEMADESEVQAALGQRNSAVAGFYTSNILGPYAVTLRRIISAKGDFTPDLVLHHEYAHHFMLQYFPANYPSWYVEGFAELIGSTRTLPDGRLAYGWPARHRGDTIAVNWVSMKDILLKPPEKVPFDLYGQGWAMTHFVTFSKERSPQMRQYLAALNAGKSPTEAAAAFGDLDRLNREAHLYVSQGSFAYTPVQVPVHEPVIEQVSDVGAAEAALIPETIAFADYDLSEVRKDEDRERARRQRAELLKRIETKTAQFPNDPAALMLLAQAERTAGNSGAAEQAANRLLALQPSNIDALVLKSRLLSANAEKLDGSQRANMVAQARHLAVEANKINQDNPLGYVAYFESMKASGEPVPPDALDALAAAVEKLPANTGIRQELVDELAAERRYALAIQALLPLASDTHDSPLRTAARERLTKLQAMAAASR
jgi:hypothetical protein